MGHMGRMSTAKPLTAAARGAIWDCLRHVAERMQGDLGFRISDFGLGRAGKPRSHGGHGEISDCGLGNPDGRGGETNGTGDRGGLRVGADVAASGKRAGDRGQAGLGGQERG